MLLIEGQNIHRFCDKRNKIYFQIVSLRFPNSKCGDKLNHGIPASMWFKVGGRLQCPFPSQPTPSQNQLEALEVMTVGGEGR